MVVAAIIWNTHFLSHWKYNSSLRDSVHSSTGVTLARCLANTWKIWPSWSHHSHTVSTFWSDWLCLQDFGFLWDQRSSIIGVIHWVVEVSCHAVILAVQETTVVCPSETENAKTKQSERSSVSKHRTLQWGVDLSHSYSDQKFLRAVIFLLSVTWI